MSEPTPNSADVPPSPVTPQPAGSADSRPVIDANQWFGDGREVWIEFAGVRYRLRLTRRGKLILQK